MSLLLEIACFDPSSAIHAQSAGADRIELCEKYSVGGITPSFETILQVRKKITVPLHVLIRPRAGDFIFRAQEKEAIKSCISFCRENNIDGIVTGALNADKTVDEKFMTEIIKLASPMPVNFHRAIDECYDLDETMKLLITIGIKRVLTSGGEKNASSGINRLKSLHDKFGSQISIMPGGNVRSANIKALMETGCKEFHTSAITNHKLDLKEIMGIKKYMQM